MVLSKDLLQPAAGLDNAKLVSTVQKLFSAGIAQSTHRAYDSDLKWYILFCSLSNLSLFSATEAGLCLFVAKLNEDNLAPSTVKSYLAAVHHAHISLGLGNPKMVDMSRLEYVVKGACQASYLQAPPESGCQSRHLFWEV